MAAHECDAIQKLRDGGDDEKHKAKILEDLWMLTVQFKRFEKNQRITNLKTIEKWMDKVQAVKDKFALSDKDHDVHEGPKELEKRMTRKKYQIGQLNALWSLLTPKIVARIVKRLGESAPRFMACLSVGIPPQLYHDYPAIFGNLSDRNRQPANFVVRFEPGHFDDVGADDGEDEDERAKEIELWDRIAPTTMVQQQQASLFSFGAAYKREVAFYWCGVQNMLGVRAGDLVELVANLAHTTEPVFSMPTTIALVENSWHIGRMYYYFDRLLDIVFIILLFRLAKLNHVSDCEGTILWYTPIILQVINYISISMRVMEVIAKFTVRMDREQVLENVLDLVKPNYATFSLVIEVFSAYQTYLMTEEGICTFIQLHPIHFALLVLLKWLQFLIGLLITHFFGLTVLPAYHAMMSPESLKFLLFLMAFVIAATHTYYALPIPADSFDSIRPIITSFVRMFRLGFFGDFDFFELEGVDPSIVDAKVKNGTITGQLDEDPENFDGTIHRDIRTIIVVLGFVITVVLMNMYIGILGNQYNDYYDRKKELFQYSRAVYLVRYLLRQRFLGCCGLFAKRSLHEETDQTQLTYDEDLQSLLGSDSEDECNDPADVPNWFVEEGLPKDHRERNAGCWIVLEQEHLKDDEASCADVLDSNKALLAEIRDMKRQMRLR